MKTVILAEKPSQARAYVEAFETNSKCKGYYIVNDPILATDTIITYGFGHLVELAPPEKYDEKYKHWELEKLPIFPKKYKFIVPKEKKIQFNLIKGFLNQADTIIIATDSDREGENIAWSIMKQANIDLKNKTIKRLWINSLEKDAIRTGFKSLKDGWKYYPIFKEAQTRQISDWLVGMNGSPLYSLCMKKAGLRKIYSIGRVQTPTLYMIYKRDQAIANFKPEPYFELEADIQVGNQAFTAKLDPTQRFKDQATVDNYMSGKNILAGTQQAVIKNVERVNKDRASPRLFSLSSLQSVINKRYHASASDTLEAVQSLYEAKYLSYPRTDCQYITEQEFKYLNSNLGKYLQLVSKEVTLPITKSQKRYVDGKKVQEHHAIIMTKTVPNKKQLDTLPELQQKIYNLVLRTTLAMFTEPYQYEQTKIITQVGKATFKATGNVPIRLGWKAILDDQQQDDKNTITLPSVQQGQVVTANASTIQKETTPPTAFTEGTIITAMKTAGKTVDDDEAASILNDVEGIGTEATRSNILEILKKRHYLFTKNNKLHVTKEGNLLCKAVESEPLLISAEMTAKWEKALRQISSAQRTQENFLDQIKKFIRKLIKEVPQQFEKNTALNQQILAFNKEKNDQSIVFKDENVTVIEKSKFYIVKPKNKDNYTLPKKWASKAIGKTIIKELVLKGQTKKLKGFKSKKTGKEFQAKLKLNNGTLKFDFN